MKKAIKQFFLTVLAIVGLIFLGIGFAIALPFDYIKYKRSLYYKKERRKYTLLAATGAAFDLYNEILKHDLPIRFYENPYDPAPACGWFVLDDTLIVADVFSFEFDEESGLWRYCCDEDEQYLSLEEYIEREIAEANELSGQVICSDAVVLVDGDYVGQIEKLKAEKRFLVYENDREEVLKRFCEDPTKWRNEQ